ncbi:putative anti-sigma factor [Pedobacter sp. BAL39]|uniref:FecR family protein n=1 Tax=Pedobacter sp. BAL39 TaxID=391596 RepID=UPI00015598D1|nr:FecR domain-containing protein [Pedobacter sp. BAL39]EDM37274.1 putative anti-sigma factor [Pedobacter sp. BAL39]
MDYLRKKDLFRRYSKRRLNEAELNEFFELLQSGALDADYDRLIAELEEESAEARFVPSAESRTRVGKRLNKYIQADRKRHTLKWLWQAASVAAVLLIIGGGYRVWQEQEFLKLTRTYVTVSVPVGNMKIVELSDGTKVTLSSGTVFRYPKKFTRNAREVFLEDGRGFFDVAKDKTKPFTVRSAKLATTALGTSFIVQNYKKYGYEKISLYTGKVRIAHNDDVKDGTVILHPGQEFEQDSEHRQDAVKSFSLAKDPMTSGTLKFSKDRLDEVLYNIAAYYHVQLQFNPEHFRRMYVTGSFQQGNAKEILRSIAFTHHLVIKDVNQTTYSIMKK